MSGNSMKIIGQRPNLPQQPDGVNRSAQPQQIRQVGGRPQAPAQAPLQEVSEQLTLLLNRVAKRSTKGVNLKDVNDLAQSREALTGKAKKYIHDIALYAKGTQRKLEALNSLTGDQIANAFNAKKGEWTGEVGKRITAAQAALAKVSDLLLKLLNNPKIMADGELHALIEEKYMKNCCRESELTTVLMNAVDLKGDGKQPLTDDAKLKLKQSVGEWMRELAPQMHGTDEVINLKGNPDLQKLQRLLGELKGNDEANVSAEMRQSLTDAAKAVQAHFRQAARAEGTIDRSFFRSADKIFTKILESLAGPRQAALESLLERHCANCFDLPPAFNFSQAFIDALRSEKANCPLMAKYIDLRKQLSQEIRALVAAHRQGADGAVIRALNEQVDTIREQIAAFLDREIFDVEDNRRVNRLQEEAIRLTELAKAHNDAKIGLNTFLPQLPEKVLPELFNCVAQGSFEAVIDATRGVLMSTPIHLAAAVNLVNRFGALEENLINTKQLLSGIFTNELPISTLIECRANGIQDRDIDPTLCDANIAQRKTFGQGGANTVYEVTMKDGRVFIFKPEDSGRSGVGMLLAGKGAYERDVNITALNIAVHEAADFLGVGETVVDSKVGICNGQLGVFMEKAPGRATFSTINQENERGKPIKHDPFREMDKATFCKVNGQLMQKTYNLEWLDFIVGSSDRHQDNYFVQLSGGSVAVKGIDNDLSFGRYRSSFTEVTLDKSRTRSFISNCRDFIESRFGRNRRETTETFVNKLATSPGITFNEDRTKVKIDLAALKQPWIRLVLKKTTGMHQRVPPCVIDRGLYNRLMELDNAEQQALYRARLTGRMNEKNVEIAMNRLTTAIAYAKKLNDQGRVIENWERASEQKKAVRFHDSSTQVSPEDDTAFRESANRTAFANDMAVKSPGNQNNLYFRDFGEYARKRLEAIPEEEE